MMNKSIFKLKETLEGIASPHDQRFAMTMVVEVFLLRFIMSRGLQKQRISQ